MYYDCTTETGIGKTCYAESKNGISWNKVNMGLFPINNWNNNIVVVGTGSLNFTPFIDTHSDTHSKERYKAIGGYGTLYTFSSPDGIHWKIQHKFKVKGADGDTQNVVFWDSTNNTYAAYIRSYSRNRRSVVRVTSPDFIHWSEPKPLRFTERFYDELYTPGISRYYRSTDLFLGFPTRFTPKRGPTYVSGQQGVTDGVFMTSRDGILWNRFKQGWIRPGLDPINWNHGSTTVSPSLIQTSATEMSLYYVQKMRTSMNQLRRATLRIDGFVSLKALEGEFTTKPLLIGKNLYLNYSTSAAGSVRVMVLDEQGKPIPGYGCELYGDAIEAFCSNLQPLQGKKARLQFTLKDADLYSLRFQ